MSTFRVTNDRDDSRSFTGGGRNQGQGNRGRGAGGRGNRGGGNNYQRDSYQGLGSGYGEQNEMRGGYGRPRSRGYRGNHPRGRQRSQTGPANMIGSYEVDGDVSMGGDSQSQNASRYTPYAGRTQFQRSRHSDSQLDSTRPSGALSRLGVPVNAKSTSPWHKVTISHARTTEKEFLIKSIINLCDVPFVPVNFRYEGKAAVFYVNDLATANAIRNTSRRITKPDGFKMIIVVRPCDPPVTELSDEVVEKLKVCMSGRYDVASKSLDLKGLHGDSGLNKECIHLALSRPNVMSHALRIIGDYIPELTSLSLASNRLYSLKQISSLAQKAPALCNLDLSNNMLRSEVELDPLKKMKLVTLSLSGNPICDRFKEKRLYVSAIRKCCPKLCTLDGEELPPPITFDVESPTDLPTSQGSYFTNAEVQNLVCRFLKEYYTIYDSKDRQQLLGAYHDQVLFSMSFTYNKLTAGDQHNFSAYIQSSRNLLKMAATDLRQKYLKRGKVSVVATLSQLPETQHDDASLIIDVQHVSASFLTFTVTGLYKETAGKTNPVRSFSRTFITVPQDNGIVIVNESMIITNASSEQKKKAFQPAVAASSCPVPDVVASATTSPSSTSQPGDDVKAAMVKQFSAQSRMNEEWATICLVQNNWNFDKAATSFTELHGKGSIPPDAFLPQ